MVKVVLKSRLSIQYKKLPNSIAKLIIESVTYDNPKFIQNDKFGFSNYNTPQYIENYLIDEEWLHLPRGTFDAVLNILNRANITFELIDKRLKCPKTEYKWSKVKLRKEQQNFIDDLVKAENGLGLAFTSFGKSLTCLEMIAQLKQPALILVHTTFLQKQWLKEATNEKLFNIPKELIGGCGGIFSGTPKLGLINICLYHTLSKENMIKLYKDRVGIIIQDEVQKAPIDSVQKIINRFAAKYRFGVSANHERKDGLQFLTEDAFGQVVHKAVEKDTDSKILSEIYFYPTNYADYEYEFDKNYSAMITRMSLDSGRNKLILQRCFNKVKLKKQVMILVQRKEQAFLLASALEKKDLKVGILAGAITEKDIKDFQYRGSKEIARKYNDKQAYDYVKKYGEKRQLHVIIGTQKAEVGLSLRTLNHLIITTPIGDIENRLNQMIGRVERKHGKELEGLFGTKPVPTVDIFLDQNLSASKKMIKPVRDFYNKRVKILKNNI